MSSLITKDYEGISVQFTGDGWFNATVAAKRFNKRPVDWLRLPDTIRYLDALCSRHEVGKSHFLKSLKGKGKNGTWLHPKLAVVFARWLSVDFAVWCDEQIESLIRGELNQKRARHQAASSFKMMSAMLKDVRDLQGKATQKHHYANEAKLINWAMTGQFTRLDRDSLHPHELDLLARLEERNAILLGMKMSYHVRKQAMKEYAKDYIAISSDSFAAQRLESGQEK